MSDPLRGLRIWITRPEPAVHESVRRWRVEGALARAVPLIALKALDPPASSLLPLLDLVPRPLVVLTSAAAAEHFARILRLIPGASSDWHCVVVGDKTAAIARARGLDPRWVSARATGVDLAEELLQREQPREVVLPGSDLRRPDVEERLQRGGCRVHVLTLYENERRSELRAAEYEALRKGEVDSVAFYSPSAVHAWLGLSGGLELKHLRRPAMVALGPTTADEVRTSGLQLVASPEDPGEEGLIRETSRWWSGTGLRR